MQTRPTAYRILFPLAILAAVSLGLCACDRTEPAPKTNFPPLTMCIDLSPTNALTLIADADGFFSAAGLDITLKEYPSGKLALGGLLAGECDLTTSAEIPVMIASFAHDDLKILASLANSYNVNRVIARRDRGIRTLADLRGKRISTQRGSAVHFFLHLVLAKQGYGEEDITLSFLPAVELPQALAHGDIDAFSMREPFISEAQKLLGDNAVVFAEPGLYSSYQLLVGRGTTVTHHSEQLVALLQALSRAKQFALHEPDAAKKTFARALAIEPARVDKLWPELQLTVELSQSMLHNLESAAAWIQAAHLVEAETPPNVLNLVWSVPLKLASPDVMTIVE
jgi:ABC-type nitrate/sulfonate/bicarbonate transport system substrate-binding protein